MIRRTTVEDIASVMEIIADAQQRLRDSGVDQWQDGYPTAEIIAEDIASGHSFVYVEEGRIVATAVISFDGEITYDTIDGQWLNDNPFVVVHRLAVRKGFERQGVARKMLDFAHQTALIRGVTDSRVDTHSDNKAMQQLLYSLDYQLCGEITLLSAAKRLAYQKLLK